MSDLELRPPGYTHADLVKRAASWLANRQNCRFVLCETQAGTGESPDAIGWKYGTQSHLVEVKVSRSDFFADRDKPFRRNPARGVGMFRWLMVPAGLITEADMAALEGWGLLAVQGRSARVVRKAAHQAAVNREAEVSVLVQAVANAQLCAPMDLNDWFSHPESVVGKLRAQRRRIADEERERQASRCCGAIVGVAEESFSICHVLVANGHDRCSEHGGRSRKVKAAV